MTEIFPLQAGGTENPSGGKASAVKEQKEQQEEHPPKKKTFPKGTVVLGKDGKPCRSCTSFRDWAKMTAHTTTATTPVDKAASSTSSSSSGPPPDCPPDVETLGRATWTLLHTIAATYPPSADAAQQRDMKTFLSIFSRIYPCWVCAEDFQGWIGRKENRLEVVEEEKGRGGGGHLSGRKQLERWMCNAHNEVNVKLGKKVFDCDKVEERWRTGWRDGRCG